MTAPPVYAFLSSRIDPLAHQRALIAAACERQGVSIWVSDIKHPEWCGAPLDEIAAACVKIVRDADVFVFLSEGTYGGTASAELGDLSILELEATIAAMSGRPIDIFRLGSTCGRYDSRLEGLVATLAELPTTTVYEAPGTEDQVASQVAEVLAQQMRTSARRAPLAGRLLRGIARRLDPRQTDIERELDEPSLRSPFHAVRALPRSVASVARARTLLSEAESLADFQRRVLKLWSALRHLAATPWRESDDPATLEAWLRLLAQWDRTTAWLGAHGGTSTFLSRLAAQRERQQVWDRYRRSTPCAGSEDEPVPPEGASASLLYSLAKRQVSWFARGRLLKRALQVVTSALESTTARDVSGLLSTRAYILRALGLRLRAVHASKHALELRRAEHEQPGRIGEAEATHGWMLAGCLRLAEATRFLESGLGKMRHNTRHGFLIRAMRQLGFVRVMRLKLTEARTIWLEAEMLASRYELHDQLGRLQQWLAFLERLQRRFGFVDASAPVAARLASAMSYHDDTVPLRHMLDDARRARAVAAPSDAHEQHLRDLALQRLVTAVGDAARRVTEATHGRHPSIARDTLVRAGNGVRAEYDSVDVDSLRQTVRKSYPELVEQLEHAVAIEAQRSVPPPLPRAAGLTIPVPRQRLAELCERYHIRRLALFGSVLREDFAPGSDVDVLVEFEPGHTPGLGFFTLPEDLASMFRRPIDLADAQLAQPLRRPRTCSLRLEDAQRMRHTLDHAREAGVMCEGRTRSHLDKDRQLQPSVIRLIKIVGEAANGVSRDTRQAYPTIAWREAVTVRNRVIHGYDLIDPDIVWEIATHDFPTLAAEIEKILDGSGS